MIAVPFNGPMNWNQTKSAGKTFSANGNNGHYSPPREPPPRRDRVAVGDELRPSLWSREARRNAVEGDGGVLSRCVVAADPTTREPRCRSTPTNAVPFSSLLSLVASRPAALPSADVRSLPPSLLPRSRAPPDTLRASGASRREVEDALRRAATGRPMRDDASTTASARRSSSRRNSIAATHGVIAPRVGRAGGGGGGGGSGGGGRAWRGGGVKTKAAIDRDASPLEPYDANSLPRGRDNEAAKDALAATMEWG